MLYDGSGLPADHISQSRHRLRRTMRMMAGTTALTKEW